MTVPCPTKQIDMQMTTQLEILSSSFMGNWVWLLNCSQSKTAIDGLIINLPYQAHPHCNVTLADNIFINNTAGNAIGVGAFQLTVSSNTFSASHVLVCLTNNSFLQNKVNGSYTGSGSVEFFIQGYT